MCSGPKNKIKKSSAVKNTPPPPRQQLFSARARQSSDAGARIGEQVMCTPVYKCIYVINHD